MATVHALQNSFLSTKIFSPFANNRIGEFESVDDVLKKANLNFEFKKMPAGGMINNQFVARPGRFYVHRSDDPSIVIGNDVSTRFQPVQPRELIGTFVEICKQGQYELDAVGYVDDGARFWATAKTNVELRVMGQDKLSLYLFMSTANDGSLSTIVKPLTFRMACNNKLSAAIATPGYKGWQLKIPHSTQVPWDRIAAQLQELPSHIETFQANATRLAQRSIDREEMLRYFISIYGNTTNSEDALRERIHALCSAYFNAPGSELRSAQDTAWGLVNAVTYFEDHVNGSLKRQKWNAEKRFSESMLDQGETRKQDAWRAALALIA